MKASKPSLRHRLISAEAMKLSSSLNPSKVTTATCMATPHNTAIGDGVQFLSALRPGHRPIGGEWLTSSPPDQCHSVPVSALCSSWADNRPPPAAAPPAPAARKPREERQDSTEPEEARRTDRAGSFVMGPSCPPTSTGDCAKWRVRGWGRLL